MEKLKGILILVISWFSLGMIIFSPFLAYETYQARSPEFVDAKVTSSYYFERSRQCSLRFEAVTLETQETIKLGNARPGDFSYCGDSKRVAGRYKRGQIVTLLKVGDDYYLEHGNYKTAIYTFSFAVFWFTFMVYRVKSYRKALAKSEKINAK